VGSFGQAGDALASGGGEEPQLAGARVRLDEERRHHHHVDLPAEEVGDRGPGALVGNVHDVDAEKLLEVIDADVRGRAEAEGAVGERARVGAGVGDELLEAASGHRRVHGDHPGKAHEHGNRSAARQDRRPHLARGAPHDALSRQIGARSPSSGASRSSSRTGGREPDHRRRVRGEIRARRQHPSRVGCLVVRHQPAPLPEHGLRRPARLHSDYRAVRFPWVVAVHPSVPLAASRSSSPTPAPTRRALLRLLRPRSSAHISVDYLKKLLGIDIVHVPYKGAGPAVTDLLSGQIHMMMVTPLLVEPHARAGKLRLLAAATRERIARLPELPTVSESGVAGYEAGNLVRPCGARRHAARGDHALYADVKKVLNEPAFKERYVEKQWFEIVANTPDEFAAFLGNRIRALGESHQALGGEARVTQLRALRSPR